uniref:TF-B3 domain-containing protein n=1 Tax=Quercus lobata TaxID=97700 RepID=A0A7N2KZS9_QUELO
MTFQWRRDNEDGPADLTTKAPHFFKIVMPQTLQEGKLRIPKKFTSKYGVDLSNMAFLTVPNGTKWKVKMTKCNGEVWFQNGWCEFARCHALALGHLLVFRYEGKSHFYVLIFDATATEIDYPFDDQHQVRRMEDIERDDIDNSLEIVDGFMPRRKTREKSPLPCPLPNKRAKTNPGSSVLHAGGDTHFRPELTKSKGSVLEKSKMNAGVSFTRRESKAEECNGATKRCPKSEGIERTLSASEKDRALQRVRAFESKNPFFMLVMQPSYVYPGNSLGWKKFAQDNNLKVGDVCIFELINGVEVAFKVSIFRAANDIDCPLLNGSAHGVGRNRVGRKSSPLVKPESDCNMEDVSLSRDHCPTKDGGVGMSTNRRRLKAKALVKNQECKVLEKKQELMTTNGKAENLVRANAFKSDNPLFMVIMQPSYIRKGGMSLPSGIFHYLLRKGFITKGSVLTVKLQVADRLWPVKLYAYEGMYQRSSCKLYAGWSAFATENTLRVGCTVAVSTTYQKKASRNMPMEVHVLYVMLQVVDRLWPVKLHNYSCSCSSYELSLGWSAFVRENALQVGDVCIRV